MTGFADMVKNTDIPEVGDFGRYDGPPRIRWSNGTKSKQRGIPDVPGTFYASEKTLAGFEPGAPWQRVERYEDEVGYEAEELRVIFISRRSQPFSEEKVGNRTVRTYQQEWTPGVSKSVFTEYLCYVDGFGAEGIGFGLVVLGVKGMVGKRMEEELSRFRKEVLSPASAVISQGKGQTVRAPLFLFAVEIAPERNPNGAYAFSDTGHGSVVQLPVMRIPAKVTDQTFSQMYVGPDLLGELKDVYNEYREWRDTKRANRGDSPAMQPPSNGHSSHHVSLDGYPDDEGDIPFG